MPRAASSSPARGFPFPAGQNQYTDNDRGTLQLPPLRDFCQCTDQAAQKGTHSRLVTRGAPRLGGQAAESVCESASRSAALTDSPVNQLICAAPWASHMAIGPSVTAPDTRARSSSREPSAPIAVSNTTAASRGAS